MQTWGAIFDWDGVVIDSSRPHELSWQTLAREEGRSLPPDHFKRGFGMKSERIVPEILRWTDDPIEIARLIARKGELYRAIIRQDGIELLPGVLPWLERLKAAGVRCVIASSTNSKNIRCAMEVLRLGNYFAGMVAGENVSHGKPDPEVFLLAARKLGVPPGRCVVFEDAHVGIEAARAAGMKVIGVATTHPAETLQDADRVVTRLDELTVEELSGWFESSLP
jgi:beta-phosphoglucomutase family hydrolase